MTPERKEKLKNVLRKIGRFLLNPRLLLCIGLAWMITNGWAYLAFGAGTYFGIPWLAGVGGGYLALLWIPFTPEKILTCAIAIVLLRLLFPGDEKTLAILKGWWKKAKEKGNVIEKFKAMSRPQRLNRILYVVAVASFLIPIVFLIVRMLAGGVPESEAGYHSKADYALMILQCVLGLVTINIPWLLARRFRFEVPLGLYTVYIVFLYCAIFLGEVRSFYYLIPYWDVILHACSSLMSGFFGFMVIMILNRDEHTVMNLSHLFVAVFAFCFAVTIGTLWEMYEYLFDGLFGMNMQKFMTADGVVLSGHAALADTMEDILIDALGALVASLVGYFSLRRNWKWIYPKLKE